MRRCTVPILYALLVADLLLLPLEFRLPEGVRGAFRNALGMPELSWIEMVRVVLHVTMFIPVGAFLRRRLDTVPFFAAAITLALAAELVQLFVPRTISALDVACNLAGLMLGGRWLRAASASIRWRRPASVAAAAGAIALAGLAVHFALPVSASWETWDLSFPLVLGDEADGLRPWSGELHEIAIFDRSLDADLARALAGSRFADHQPLVHFAFEADELIPDGDRIAAVAASPAAALPLRLQAEGTVRASGDGGVVLEPPGRLVAPRVGALAARLRAAGAATIALRVRCLDPAARGPARIMSLSRSIAERNLTIGQEGDAVHVRVRNAVAGPNGVWPELVVADTIESDAPLTIVAVCAPHETRLYANGSPRGRVVYRRAHRLIHDVFDRPLTLPFAAGTLFAVAATCTLAIEQLFASRAFRRDERRLPDAAG